MLYHCRRPPARGSLDAPRWLLIRPTLLSYMLQISGTLKAIKSNAWLPSRAMLLTVRLQTHDRLTRVLFQSVTKQSPESVTNSGDKALTILEQAESSNLGNLWLPDAFPLLSYKCASLFGSFSNTSSTEKFFKSLLLFMISHPSKSFLRKIKYP